MTIDRAISISMNVIERWQDFYLFIFYHYIVRTVFLRFKSCTLREIYGLSNCTINKLYHVSFF